MNKKGKIKSSLVFIGGTFAAGAISFFNAPILTRCLSTEMYIRYSILISFVAAINAVSFCGYDSCYMRFYHKNPGMRFLFECLKIPFLVCAFCFVFLFAFRTTILASIFGFDLSMYECLFLSIYILVRTIARFTLITMRMEGASWNYVLSDCLERVLFIVIVVVGVAFCFNIDFLFIVNSFLISYIVEIIINWGGFGKTIRSFKVESKMSVSRMDMFKYSIFIGIGTCVMFLAPLVHKVVIRSLLDANDVAIFFSSSIFTTAISLISISVNNLWQPTVYRAVNENNSIKDVFHKYGVFLSWVLLVVLGLVIIFRRWLVMILAEQYHDVYIIAPTITFAACMEIIYHFYSVGIEIEKKTWLRPIINAFELLITVIFVWMFSLYYGLQGVALAILLGSIIGKVSGILIGLKYYDTGCSIFIPSICLGLCFLVSLFSLWIQSILFDLTIGLTVIFIGSLCLYKEIKSVLDDLFIILLKRKVANV